MIRTFDLEDYEKLKPYRDHLTRAFYGNYTYGLTRATFETLSSIYKSLGYSQRLDYTCGACLLNLCKTLGSYFFPFEEKLKEENKSEEDDLTEEELEKLGDEINKAIVEDMQNNNNTEPQKKTVAKSTTATKKTAQKGQKTTGRRTAAKK